MNSVSFSSGNSLIKLANIAVAAAALQSSGSLLATSSSQSSIDSLTSFSSSSSYSSSSSFSSPSSYDSIINDQSDNIKLTTAMVEKTVSDVSSDSSQSLSTQDSRSSSQSDSGSETTHHYRSSSSKKIIKRESGSKGFDGNSSNKVKPGRKSKSAPEEDPRQKKVRSLERNRAAAMRCREKRKMAIKALENNADEMQKLNDRLQGEVAILRKKVTEFKTALLAHKDCPVTLQLRKKDDPCSPIVLQS